LRNFSLNGCTSRTVKPKTLAYYRRAFRAWEQLQILWATF
jgi:hypothetical protein